MPKIKQRSKTAQPATTTQYEDNNSLTLNVKYCAWRIQEVEKPGLHVGVAGNVPRIVLARFPQVSVIGEPWEQYVGL
jgi:hypothetical protein